MATTIEKRAESIAKHGTIEKAIEANAIAQYQTITVSEAIVLGLLRQRVTKYFGIFGHGSTDIAEVLRVYEEHGLVTTYNVRHETAAAHAATVLNMLTGEVGAVVTSIGPGALHAFAVHLRQLLTVLAYIIFMAMKQRTVKASTCSKFQKMNRVYFLNCAV